MSTAPLHASSARPAYVAVQNQGSSPPPAPPLPPPPAPPLPSTKYVQRAATAFGRLAHPFFLGSRPSSAQGHRVDRGRPGGIRPAAHRSSSPLSSQSTTHKTGIPIAALDISPERTHVIIAGRDILKTVKVGHASCTEDFNIRSNLTAYASTHHTSRDAAAAQHRDQLAAKDVKWSRGNFSTTVATAAANGKIVVYDINRPSIEVGHLHEHARQVHKLAFNPHQGALLISGSQDGTVRMWDMRDLRTDRAARITGSIKRFMGHSDGVRDLKWSPSDGVEFATGTDAGAIQRWDFRKENAPLLKLNAHDKTCMSLDWHPSGRYLASGSADKTIKVWDFRSSDRRMRPYWQLRAPQAVTTISWRPGSTLAGDGSIESRPTFKPSTCLASSYDARDPRIHVWDFRRPHVPFQEIDKYDNAPSDFLWHSEDLLWSVGRAGMFVQTDLNFVPKPLDRMSINVLAADPESGLCFFSEPRSTARISLAEAEDYFLRRPTNRDSSGEKLSGSHSANEGSFEESTQHSNPSKKRRPKFAGSRLSSQNANSPAIGSEDAKVFDFQSLESMYRSTQTAAIGRVRGVFDVDAFRSLARDYELPRWVPGSSDEQILKSLENRFEHNATVAAKVGHQRLAQTWRILRFAAHTELSTNIDNIQRKQTSVKPFVPSTVPNTAIPDSLLSPKLGYAEVSKALHGLATFSESGSNVPTPLARPVHEMPSIPLSDEHSLEADSRPDCVPLWRQRRSSVQLNSPQATARDHPSLRSKGDLPAIVDTKDIDTDPVLPSFAEMPDLERQMEQRRNAMNNYRTRPRTLLRLDDTTEDSTVLSTDLQLLDRHNSNESFQMLSGSTDSDPRSMPLAGSFGESRSLDSSAANSFSSSVNQDLTAWGQTRLPQLRRSEAVKVARAETEQPLVRESSESPLLETMSFPMEQEQDNGNLQMFNDQSRLVHRPTTMIPPKIHRESNEDVSGSSSAGLSLLLANPTLLSSHPQPWSLSALLPTLLEYHLETLCDTQIPSILALSLYPLCPSLFSNSPPPPTYLLAYHELLICLQLFTEAADLRKCAQFIFPDIGLETTVDQGRGTGADQAGLWCNSCRKPVKGNERGWCQRCCSVWGECSICELSTPPSYCDPGLPEIQSTSQAEPQDVLRSTALWSWCQGCGHGGHTQCMRVWWRTASGNSASKVSNGVCPIVGCTHACISGPRRDAQIAAIAAASKRERNGSVTRDSWIAGESRAAEAAARVLGGRGSSGSKTALLAGSTFGSATSRVPVEEAIVVVDSERSGIETPREGIPRSLSGGGRSLSGGGRSFSGGGRRVRLALPGTTPPAAASAVAGLRESDEQTPESLA